MAGTNPPTDVTNALEADVSLDRFNKLLTEH
jgi:hypothetical protein